MKAFCRNFFFCALFLALLSFAYNFASDTDYTLIEKEVETGDSLALRDLEYFRQEHGEDSDALLFYHIMHARLLTQKGEEVPLDSLETWVAQAQQTEDGSLYAQSLVTLASCHAARGELSQALDAQQRALRVTNEKNAASTLHERYKMIAMAVILGIVVALCLTFLHFYLQERTKRKHKEQRLALARKQLQLSAESTDQFLASIQELQQKVEEGQNSSSQITLSEIGARMNDEMCSLRKQQISLALTALYSSDIAERFRESVTDRRMRISEKDWNALTELFSQQLPQLITLLKTNGAVTSNERRICMLTLLEMGTLETGAILNLQSSSVSSAKKSLLTKLTGDAAASAKDLKTKIIGMIATL